MIYNFSDIAEKNNIVEKELILLKNEYKKTEMSDEQFEKMRLIMKEVKLMDIKERNRARMKKAAVITAAFVAAIIILTNTSVTIAHAMEQIPVIGQLVKAVTFRDYKYETDRNMADIEVPEIKVEGVAEDSGVQDNLDRTTEEINAEIKEITDGLIKDFEVNLQGEMNYQDIVVKSEVLTTTQDYFTLKLICYQGAGSGYQWNYYYTIDLNTGERLQLKDIFIEGADFITPISENIKEQMKAQMASDDMVYYWLDDEIEEWNFKAITEETSFYLDERDNVVIGFNEGDVAPMYMGTVEFEIPAEVLSDIRK